MMDHSLGFLLMKVSYLLPLHYRYLASVIVSALMSRISSELNN